MKKILRAFLLVGVLSFSFTAMANASIFYIWDADIKGIRNNVIGAINGYTGARTGKNNYNYSGPGPFSANPFKGPNPHGFRLKMFVYERTNGKDFLNIMGGKFDAGPDEWRSFEMDIEISGSTLTPHKVQGDEPRELLRVSTDPYIFEGDWTFKKNTDGGVIGGLQGDWEAKITLLQNDLNRILFDSNGSANVRVDELWNGEGYDNTYFITRTDTNVVPEPASLFLMGSGLFGAFLRRRKRS